MKFHFLLAALAALAVSSAAAGCMPTSENVEQLEQGNTECKIDAGRSLLIRDPAVVDDARATGDGPFGIRHLLRETLAVDEGADLEAFGAGSGCHDSDETCRRMSEPPRLVAIVNRLDLTTEENPVGELRFVYQRFHDVTHFSARKQGQDPLLGKFLNFEYDLSSVRDANGQPIARHTWAKKLHELDALPLGSPAYFAKLEAITELVTRRGAAPGRQNGAALRAIRTSAEYWYPARDIWQLGSFVIATEDHPAVAHGAPVGRLIGAGLDRTPETHGATRNWRYVPPYRQGDQGSLFALLIDHEAEVLAGKGLDFLPRKIGQAHGLDPVFRASTIDVMNGSGQYLTWETNYGQVALPPGWTPERWTAVATMFAKRTCDGCHGFHTGTSGNHFEMRAPGAASQISAFLESELPKRAAVAKQLACGPVPPPPPQPDAGAPVDAGPGVEVEVVPGPPRLSVTGTHACVVEPSGSLRCWGNDSVGQIAPATLAALPRGVRSVHAGGGLRDGHVHVLLEGGAVLGWGGNHAGQLGNGAQADVQATPVAPTGIASVAQMSEQYSHGCAIVDDGVLTCWGPNFTGEIGAGTGMALTPRTVALPAKAASVATGAGFTCALLVDGSVHCWGQNQHGQVDGSGVDRDAPVQRTDVVGAKAVVAGGAHACALLSDGRVQCWGSNTHGQVGLAPSPTSAAVLVGDLPANVVALGAGGGHTCALTSRGHAWCWGWNYRGQLGNRRFVDAHVPQPVHAIGGTILEIAAGGEQTCARIANGDVMCWGSNYFGEGGRANPDPSAMPLLVQ